MIQLPNNFVEKLLDKIVSLGIPKSDIECILLEGSYLYLKNCAKDIDCKVIVKYPVYHLSIRKPFVIDGISVDCVYFTFNGWKNITNLKTAAYYIAESVDMKCIYGNDKEFHRFDCVNDKEVQKFLLNVWDKNFFNFDKKLNPDSVYFEPKRLWNFLLFAYKVVNGSHTLTNEQLEELYQAHELRSKKEDYRYLFNQVKQIIMKGD